MLSGGGTNIVQFMGHSGLQNGNGMLAFENESGYTSLVRAADFVEALNGQTLLVVLNSCDSAVTLGRVSDTQDDKESISQLSNIAQAVVHEGVPYALGMQFALLDNAALKITDVFYESLLQGRSIEESVRLMRFSLQHSSTLPNASWLACVPVLYTRMREPVPAIKLDTGQPTIVPDPKTLTQTVELSTLKEADHFVGRAEQISQALSLLLDSSAHDFVVLRGLGGIGKTTLARVIAERVSWHYQDRVLAYSFETFARFDYEGAEVPSSVDAQFAARFYSNLASFYDLDPRQYSEPRDLQRAILQHRMYTRSLLVLDNIETLIYAEKSGNADAAALARFVSRLKEGDGSILLTTREMLPIGWGQRKDILLTGLSDDAGAELFLSSIYEDRRHATTPETRAALSHYVKGHPLCIRLLTGRFSEESVPLATFLKNIQTELANATQTTSSSDNDPRRHASIGDCMNYSIRRLTPEQTKVLYTIGIFRAPFRLRWAENVLDDKEHTEKYLQDLVRLGLVERIPVVKKDDSFALYELHPMLSLHIKLKVATLDAETRKRYALVFEDLIAQAWGLEYGYDRSASTRYLMLQSLPDCEAALENESTEAETRSSLAYHLAEYYKRMGQIQHALQLYEQSLQIDQELGEVRSIAVTQHAMADVLVGQGKIAEAMELYKQALQTKQELGDVREIAVTQTCLGDLLWGQREYVQALTMVWSAYNSLREDDFPPDVQWIRSYLIWFKQQFSEAEQPFDALWLQATAEPQPDWLLTVQAGSSVKNDATEEAQEPSEEFQAIVAFVNTENWDATQRVVEEQQEVLFTPETERVFEQVIEQAKASGEQRTVQILETHLAILHTCKTDGIEATFARIREGQQGA